MEAGRLGAGGGGKGAEGVGVGHVGGRFGLQAGTGGLGRKVQRRRPPFLPPAWGSGGRRPACRAGSRAGGSPGGRRALLVSSAPPGIFGLAINVI